MLYTYRRQIILALSSVFFIYKAFCNPFHFNYPSRSYPLTAEDYVNIQNEIRKIDIKPLLEELYKECNKDAHTPLSNYYDRCTRGINTILIDLEQGLFPEHQLIKIGSGGDRCIVCYTSLNGPYPEYCQSIKTALENVSFNGYFLYYIGGYPNPTGSEIQYCAVPYAFKVFAMVQAHHYGFNQILWIDSACLPLKDPTPIFNSIETNGACIFWNKRQDDNYYIFPRTQKLLKNITGVEIGDEETIYVGGAYLGLNMQSPLAPIFIKKFYELVALGDPFLSAGPEEYVWTAILNQEEFRPWKQIPTLPKILFLQGNDTILQQNYMKTRGYYFYHRKAR